MDGSALVMVLALVVVFLAFKMILTYYDSPKTRGTERSGTDHVGEAEGKQNKQEQNESSGSPGGRGISPGHAVGVGGIGLAFFLRMCSHEGQFVDDIFRVGARNSDNLANQLARGAEHLNGPALAGVDDRTIIGAVIGYWLK